MSLFQCYIISYFFLCNSLTDDDLSHKDSVRKYGNTNQALTPRHTIDAILGLKNRQHLNEGKYISCNLSMFEFMTSSSKTF